MPSLMSPETFNKLSDIRASLASALGAGNEPADAMVPWAGAALKASERGVYFVGIALDAEEPRDETYEMRLQGAEQFCATWERKGSPFWQYVGAICQHVLGQTLLDCRDRWGWSNLLKIAGRKGEPASWDPRLIVGQVDACRSALSEELTALSNCLIVVTSSESFHILPKDLTWDESDRPGCTYLAGPDARGNFYVHSYHPKYMRRDGHTDKAVEETVAFAKASLPPF